MRQVRIGQTQTIIRKRSRTEKNSISPAETTSAGLDDEGEDCMRASLARVKQRVQMWRDLTGYTVGGTLTLDR
jgi:hypothetical protein